MKKSKKQKSKLGIKIAEAISQEVELNGKTFILTKQFHRIRACFKKSKETGFIIFSSFYLEQSNNPNKKFTKCKELKCKKK